MDRTRGNTVRGDSGPASAMAIVPVLYVVLEGERALAGGLRSSLADVREVRIGRGSTRTWNIDASGVATLEIPDPRMSTKHARLSRTDAGWRLEDLGSTNGSFADGARTDRVEIDRATVITLGATALLLHPSEQVATGTQNVVDGKTILARPRGTATLTPLVEQEIPRLLRVTMAKLPILLLGESGTGKEVLARAIHEISGRKGTFVAINCGALAPSLVESQLFGYVKGAFSGATRDEPGLVRASSGGTLFLDELGELPAAAQATLLRVLQESEVLPLGATKPIPVDLRVVAATLKPIDESPTFRRDLYARVAAFVHRIPPLRERPADLGLLIADLLPRVAPDRAAQLRLAPELVTALVSHSWPMNVRELQHALSVAVLMANDDQLRLEHLGDTLSASPASPPASSSRAQAPAARPARAPSASPSDEELRAELRAELTRTQGNVSEVARAMGKTRMQIHRWMKRFDIDPESFRSA